MTATKVLRRHLAKIVLAVVVGSVAILLADVVLAAREAARRTQCKNNLKQIELALHNYHNYCGCFPPAVIHGPDGKPWHSWRFLILPFVESNPYYQRYRFDEPWNGPNNSKIVAEIGDMPVFRCPTDTNIPLGHTSYLAVIGDGTAWPPHGVATFEDIPDRKDRTLHVVEVADSGVHWMEPVDLRLDAMSLNVSPTKGVGIRSHHGGTKRWFRENDSTGANAQFADGSVRFLAESTPPDVVRSLLLRNDAGPAEF